MIQEIAAPVRERLLPFSLPSIGPEEIAEVVECLRSGWITTGPKVERFEDRFRRLTGARHALATSSGTAALHIALLAAELKDGDEVLTTPMTFAAAPNMVLRAGGRVAFADIDLRTFNIDVKAARQRLSPRTRVLIPVHFAGLPCRMAELERLCRERGILLLEDAAHAVGASYDGRPIGSIGDMTAFSFHPIKNITTGEGGMLTFRDERWLRKLSLLRFHGMDRNAWKRYKAEGSPHYDIELPGFKYNMLDIQASIGLRQLDKLDALNLARESMARTYREEFGGVEELFLPQDPPYAHRHAWHLFTVLLRTEKLRIGRDAFLAELKREGIGTGVHFQAVHLHPYYRGLGFRRGQFPNAEYVSDRILSLPLYPRMTREDLRDVVLAVKKVLARSLKT